jgi:hypothetical protein
MSSIALKRVLKLLKKAQCNVSVINPERSSQVPELNVTPKSPKPLKEFSSSGRSSK